MSTQTHLLEFSRIVNDECVPSGIEYLSKHGLMILDAPKANILAIFPLKKLKEFAAENGLENAPITKDDVINLIKEKCNPEVTLTFVDNLLNDLSMDMDMPKNGLCYQLFLTQKYSRTILEVN